MKYNFEIKRGYIVYKDGADVVLFDSGCPISFPQKCDPFRIFPKINKYVDASVNWLRGIDSISSQQLFIDYPKMELEYGEKMSLESPVAKYHLENINNGVFAISLKIDGQKRKMILDTGAATSYLLENTVTQGASAGKTEDFYISENALFETDIFLHSTECGDCLSVDVIYGVPTPAIKKDIEACHVDGIIGYDWLRHFKVLLDVPNRSLILGR